MFSRVLMRIVEIGDPSEVRLAKRLELLALVAQAVEHFGSAIGLRVAKDVHVCEPDFGDPPAAPVAMVALGHDRPHEDADAQGDVTTSLIKAGQGSIAGAPQEIAKGNLFSRSVLRLPFPDHDAQRLSEETFRRRIMLLFEGGPAGVEAALQHESLVRYRDGVVLSSPFVFKNPPVIPAKPMMQKTPIGFLIPEAQRLLTLVDSLPEFLGPVVPRRGYVGALLRNLTDLAQGLAAERIEAEAPFQFLFGAVVLGRREINETKLPAGRRREGALRDGEFCERLGFLKPVLAAKRLRQPLVGLSQEILGGEFLLQGIDPALHRSDEGLPECSPPVAVDLRVGRSLPSQFENEQVRVLDVENGLGPAAERVVVQALEPVSFALDALPSGWLPGDRCWPGR